MKALLLAAIVATLPAMASAETVDETLLSMLHGIESEPVLSDTSGGKILFTPLSSSSFTVQNMTAKVTAKVTYSHSDNCHFNLTMSAAKDGSSAVPDIVTASLDFSRAYGLKYTQGNNSGMSHVEIEGIKIECKPSAGMTCEDVFGPSQYARYFPTVGEKERVSNAFAYFRKNFCAGSAF